MDRGRQEVYSLLSQPIKYLGEGADKRTCILFVVLYGFAPLAIGASFEALSAGIDSFRDNSISSKASKAPKLKDLKIFL
jgi:hypothetical protein